MTMRFNDDLVSRGRWSLIGLAAMAVVAHADEPLSRTAPDWVAIETFIAESRPTEAYEQLRDINRFRLDAAGHERAAELLARIAALATERLQNRLAVHAFIALAQSEAELARYRASAATLSRAESLWRENPDPATGLDLWSAHAFRLTYQGEAVAALEYSAKALALARELGDPERTRGLLVSRGQSQLQLHDYPAAIDSFNEALDMGLGGPRRIIAIASLGIAYFELNQWDQAERTFLQARDLAVASDNRRLEAWAIGELATTAARRGSNAEKALSQFDEAIAMFADLGDVRNEVIFLGNRARLLRDLGQYEQALATNLDAERRLGAIEGQRPNPIFSKNIADCLALLGRFEEAQARYRLAIQQAKENSDQKAHWQAAFGLARVDRTLGRSAEAEAGYREALSLIESLRGTLRLESFKTDFFEDKVEVYEHYVDFLLNGVGRGERIAHAFEIAERARARAFLDTLAETRANLHETLPPEIVQEEADLLAEIAEIQSQIQHQEPQPGQQEELQRAEGELEAFYLRLRHEQPLFRDLRYPQPASLAAIQQVLGPAEFLVQYFLAEPRSWVWIVSRENTRVHALPSRAEIDGAVRAAYGRMVDPGREPRDLEVLADWLLSPLAEGLTSSVSLLIVPSGSLHYFPIDLLPWGDPGETLADAAATTYLPSASALVALRDRAHVAGEPRLLAVGDPAYSSSAPGPDNSGRSGGAERLPHTREEVTRLADLFGADNATILLGAAATEAGFKDAAQARHSVVHIASHGQVASDRPERSALLFADPAGGTEDGLLQIREIYRLTLDAELVTLSACRTAMGELTTGEGITGLTRAFQYAGADSIVASLWNVNDEATAQFMSGFYRRLQGGETKAEALRGARLELKRSVRYAHPYYWAPYVLIGEGADGVHLPAPEQHSRWIAPLFLGFFALAVFAWLALKRRSWPAWPRASIYVICPARGFIG